MDRIENGIFMINDSTAEIHKIFPIHYCLWGALLSMHVLAYIYCIKCNEISICHLGVKKHISSKKYFQKYKYFVHRLAKSFSIHHGLREGGEMFKVYFNIYIVH